MRRVVLIVLGVVVAISLLIVLLGKPGMKTPAKQPAAPSSAAAMAADPIAAKLEALRRQLPADPQQAIAALEAFVKEFSTSDVAAQAMIEMANVYQRVNKLLEEKQVLERVISTYSQSPAAAAASQRLANINVGLMFSAVETPDSFLYQVQPGDTLYQISRKYETTVEMLMKSNNITSSLIKPGMKLKVVRAVFSIDVDKSDKVLTLKTDKEIIKKYLIAVGENNSTPTGKFTVLNRIVNPVWYKTGAIVPPGSPENILGTRWLGLSEPGYGIHGTTETGPIQSQTTQGCVRMRNEDVEELYTIVPAGTQVTITD